MSVVEDHVLKTFVAAATTEDTESATYLAESCVLASLIHILEEDALTTEIGVTTVELFGLITDAVQLSELKCEMAVAEDQLLVHVQDQDALMVTMLEELL